MRALATVLTITLTACMFAGYATASAVPITGDDNDGATSKPVKTALTTEQLRENFLDWKFGMFIHFNMATFNEREWATGCEDPATFAPKKLDCNQWAKAAQAARMKYAVLTVKHTGGWCLWDSEHTTHDITAFKNYRNGKGDIVREFVDACRKRGIKVGFYYCFPGDFAGRTLPKGKEDLLHGLPPEAKGDYAGFIKKQLSELLTGYGPIDLLWADQYSNKYTRGNWQEIKRHIKSLQPNCIVLANNSLDFANTDIHSYEYPWLKNARPGRALPPEDNEHAAEVCDKIGPGWFWSTRENKTNVKIAEEVVDMLKLCNSRRANYLLNVVPDKSGQLPAYAVERLRQVGRLLRGEKQTSRLKATEYHVALAGLDGNPGTKASPFKTISAAARVAQLGDTITVHEGVYRERINPPRGGISDKKRIVYQAAKGEKVVIKGSEVVKGWKKLENDTWQVIIPNSFFGDFNPFDDLIRGDWFWRKDMDPHTGAVYLNGHWLVEAAEMDEVLAPFGNVTERGEQALLNMSWLEVAEGGKRIAADTFSAQSGIETVDCAEGKNCIGQVEDGDWVQFDDVDFGTNAEEIAIRAESLSIGGTIELRLDSPQGRLMGTASVPAPGGRMSWTTLIATIKPISGVRKLCLVFKDPKRIVSDGLWFAEADDKSTTIWAQFKGADPNKENVEINVRQSVFYPEEPGINYITVRGFTLEHAATPWAPPTAEQIGLVGTHWSKGWIIENNVIRYSTCVGLTLGKHGDEFDNTSANSSTGYVETIYRGLAAGWSKENIGSHIVRNNHISHCEQAGIVGSMGAVFSSITGNEIHDIHVRRLFTGAEMGGIKIHAPIDTLISNNHIYRAYNRGIWLDWMTQGARVTGNLLHDNGTEAIRWSESWDAVGPGGQSDMFIEVNHGPLLIDNNIFLSPYSVNNRTQGVVFAHNIFAGAFRIVAHDGRQTPYHKAHSTEIVALHNNPCGDNHYYNNLLVKHGDLSGYDTAKLPVYMKGNVYLNGANPSKHETDPLVQPKVDPALKLLERPDGWYLEMAFDKMWADCKGPLVTSEMLGKAIIPDLPYEDPKGKPYRLNRDYFGKKRKTKNPYPGPFKMPKEEKQLVKVWPKD